MLRILAITVLAAGMAAGDNFYLDFGTNSLIGSTYGGAAGTSGTWNNVTALGVTTLLNTLGNSTSSSVTVTATAISGGSVCTPSSPLRDILCDNLYSFSSSWSVAFSGLTAGTIFDLYLYAPANSGTPTGDISINGSAAATSFGPGDPTALTLGATYVKLTATALSTGSLTISSGGTTTSAFSGLAGLQLVDTTAPPPPAVPEPSSWTMLAAGSLLAFGKLLRHRN